MRAAMVGGAGYMAGKSRQRSRYAEDEQDARIGQLEDQQSQQQAPPQPAPQAPAAAPAAAPDMVEQLKQLSDLKASGALTDEEFNAAKAKLLAS